MEKQKIIFNPEWEDEYNSGEWIPELRKTEIPQDYIDDFYKRISLKKYSNDGKFKMAYAEKDWLVFATYMCGMTGDTQVKIHQAYVMDMFLKYKRLVIVKARQLGISTITSVVLLWAALNNIKPVGIEKVTTIGIISKDDSSAKSLLRKYVRGAMRMLDDRMTKLGFHNYVESLLGSINNAYEIQFKKTLSGAKNGSIIMSYPPTEKAVGESFSFLFIDETAPLIENHPAPDDWIKAILPTLVRTGGHLCYSSTPRGAAGFYYEAVDPFEKSEYHEFKRVFLPFTVDPDEDYRKQVFMDYKNWDNSKWRREYCCDFEISGSNFFNPVTVSQNADDNVKNSYDFNTPVTLGVDFGWSNSRTVVTVTWRDPTDEIIKLIEYKRFPEHTTSESLINYIEYLFTVYKVELIVADNCVQGKDFISEAIRRGWLIKEFDFHSHKDKIPAYTKFKMLLNKGLIKYPKDQLLLREMKELLYEETKIGIPSIHKPRTGSDDVIDSFVMSASPYLDMDFTQVSSILVE